MFSGKKPANLVAEHDAISSSRLWLAAVLLAGVAATVTILVARAPVPAVLGFE
jgi:hypothetical protein